MEVETDPEVGVGTRIGLVAGCACVLSGYLFWSLLRLPRGLPRLVAAVPVLITYAILPFIFPRETLITGTGLSSWFFTWLGSSKLLLLCWDKGPASEPWVLASYLRFTVIMHLPIHVRRRGKAVANKQKLATASLWQKVAESQTGIFLALRCLVKVLFLGVLVRIYNFRSSLHLAVIELAYSVTLYLFCTIVLDAQAAVAATLLGVELEPHFDSPFLASSLEDFWARRWNLVVSGLLREVVYEPTRFLLTTRLGWVTVEAKSSVTRGAPSLVVTGEAEHPDASKLNGSLRRRNGKDVQVVVEASPAVASKAARFSAMLAAFVVSGILHEMVLFYMTGSWTGELLAFFSLQGVATGVQVACKPYVRKAVNLPSWLSILLTLGFIFATAVWLFFPPFMSTGADVRGLSQMSIMLRLG